MVILSINTRLEKENENSKINSKVIREKIYIETKQALLQNRTILKENPKKSQNGTYKTNNWPNFGWS